MASYNAMANAGNSHRICEELNFTFLIIQIKMVERKPTNS
jgi:hypothetical protein